MRARFRNRIPSEETHEQWKGRRCIVTERVVITGIGVVASNGSGKEGFSRALRECTSGLRFIPELRDTGLGCHVGGIPQGVDALAARYFTEEERRQASHSTMYAAIASIDAWLDAGLERPSGDSEIDWECGAIIGTGCGAIEIFADKVVPFVRAGKPPAPVSMDQAFISGNSTCVARLLGLGNQVSTNSSACSTGNEAVVEGFFRIREGRARCILAGGSEGHSKYAWAGADAMWVLPRAYNDAPEKASRPMSASAAGFVPSGGAGILLLESLTSARARGARIYAEVLAGEVNCGGHRRGGSMSAPNQDGVRRCIRRAVEMARIRPDEIGAINGHLTATFADPKEVESWSIALGLAPAKMPFIQATKSLIGHALGAAGGIECVASILQLDGGFVHGSANCEDLHPEIAAYADRIPHETVQASDLKVIAKASFGFGDVNACIIFRKFDG
jgi:3-oxoacyl-(acyl-carrier-protein) synthase